ncbi:MAG TPA: type II secretion system protein GspC [Enhygromyxa sp.]|nr:type II secretion system protein GspC [Enhygromyxa sp.]
MEALLKKYFWLIKLIGVAVVVIFAASAGVNLFVSKALLAPAGERVAESDEPLEEEEEDEEDVRQKQAEMLEKLSGTAPVGKSDVERAADIVLAGSIFCPTCAPEPAPEAVAGTAGTASAVRPGEIKSKLPLMLLATMESDDPLYSMATILQTDTNVLAPYSPNDMIRAGVVVQRVERGRVVFRNGAQMEYIELGGVPPPVTAAAAPVAPLEEENPREKSDREIEGAAEAISCDAEFTSCTVDKAFVEKLLSNPAQLTRQARIVPAVRDGETKGYKFYGIRPGSLPKLLGMKNGDLLTSVNGHQLESLDQAMDLYTKLRRASHLSVTIERQGEVVQKEIDIK